ncbi:Uma2 family endonuclease [Actinomadura sp. ATCC 31491]|uniref:Uma2 family endonuclease n=1 Tax=Actinomadura luzonensis TaxID=2805427 RepID=A0ABT0G7F4_9ACTN|nr:Uma2 family endonuclease [Actinomadura luzonensis]MCK2220523.1 Uma2 family endonuclease [Actinomadura luzonensis]
MATIEPTSTRRTVLPGAPPFTVDDLLKFPDDGNRYELFNGSLVVSPAPTPLHQDVIFILQTILHQAAPSHFKVLSTVNVRASDKDLYIPDIVVVPKARARAVRLMFDPADVLLAVEVVSPSTKVHDRGTKATAYAAAGIPAYWRVEPLEGPTLYVSELDGDVYRGPSAHKPGTTVTLAAPYPVTLDPADLVDDD